MLSLMGSFDVDSMPSFYKVKHFAKLFVGHLFLSFPFVKANIHTNPIQKDNNLFCLRTAAATGQDPIYMVHPMHHSNKATVYHQHARLIFTIPNKKFTQCSGVRNWERFHHLKMPDGWMVTKRLCRTFYSVSR